MHVPHRLELTPAIALLAAPLCFGCATTEDAAPASASSPTTAPDTTGPTTLMWEVTSTNGQIDYVIAGPPRELLVAELPAVIVAAMENADHSDLVSAGGLDAQPPTELVKLFSLPDGKTLKEVIDPSTAAAFDAWLAKNRSLPPSLLAHMHPGFVATVAWIAPEMGKNAPTEPRCESIGYRSALRRLPPPAPPRPEPA